MVESHGMSFASVRNLFLRTQTSLIWVVEMERFAWVEAASSKYPIGGIDLSEDAIAYANIIGVGRWVVGNYADVELWKRCCPTPQ